MARDERVPGRLHGPVRDAPTERKVPGLPAAGRSNWKIDREPRISDAAENVLSRVIRAMKTSRTGPKRPRGHCRTRRSG
jgi:hypothetical protein